MTFSRLTSMSLKPGAFSGQPFSLLDGQAHLDLAAILEIDLLENAPREVREDWQAQQLNLLLKHAVARSAFWRTRIPPALCTPHMLSRLPVLTRRDVTEQVRTEGALVPPEPGVLAETYASSGSTGTPVKVHLTSFNARLNTMHGLAKFFMDGIPVNEPHTFIRPASAELMMNGTEKLRVERRGTWIGRLGNVFQDAPHKVIEFAHDAGALVEELGRDRVGQLACPSTFMSMILEVCGTEGLREMGVSLWLHHTDNLGDDLAARIREAGIPISSSYSSSETGVIATECAHVPGHFHVAYANVIVESDTAGDVQVNGTSLGRLLITHLHSHATPLIRYDVGDFARLHVRCPCGHDGQTLSRLHGRGKFFLRHTDGRLIHFPVFSARLVDIAAFTEFWIHQPDCATIVVRLGGRTSLDAEEEAKLRAYIIQASDPAFKVEIIAQPEIDWSKNRKRLAFTSAVA